MTQFVIQSRPDHASLQEYLNDNPEPPCPIVGLENITEFRAEDGSKRPYYHCSLGGCSHDQGDSRQMFQHLVTQHHVITWAQEHTQAVPEEEEELIELCRKLVQAHCDTEVRTIVSDRLHEQCRMARVRMKKRDVDILLAKTKTVTKVLETDIDNYSKDTFDGNQHLPLRYAEEREKNSIDSVQDNISEELGTENQTEAPVQSGEDLMPEPLPPDEETNTESDFTIANPTASFMGINGNAGDDLPEIIEFGTTEISSNACPNNNLISTTLMKQEPVTVQTLPSSFPTYDGQISSPSSIPENPTASFMGRNGKADDLPEIIAFGTTKISSNACSNNSFITTTLKKEEPLHVLTLPSSFPTYDALAHVHTSSPSAMSIGREDHSASRKKCESLSPFISDYSPPLKGESARDLLQSVSDSDGLSNPNSKEFDASKKDPDRIFYEKVVNLVKFNLNYYFAKSSDDKVDKAGNPKQIKIKDSKEYAAYCRQFSKKFSQEIKETYEATNGTLEGIEKLSVREYGLEHHIHKYFCDRPCVE